MYAILLPVSIYIWKLQFDYADEVDELDVHPVSPIALMTGAISSAVQHWLSDHDVFHIRTNRWRRVLFSIYGIAQNRLIQRYASDPDAFQYNHAIGTVIGAIGYRLWYGLLHPLPGGED
jgi:hypothetical protein